MYMCAGQKFVVYACVYMCEGQRSVLVLSLNRVFWDRISCWALELAICTKLAVYGTPESTWLSSPGLDQHMPPCLASHGRQGVQTQVLRLAQQGLYSLASTCPLFSFLVLKSRMGALSLAQDQGPGEAAAVRAPSLLSTLSQQLPTAWAISSSQDNSSRRKCVSDLSGFFSTM